MNQEYKDPSSFDPVFDIFSTKSLTNAKLIEYQFGHGQIASQNDSIYSYDSKRLNDSGAAIEQSTRAGEAVSAGYIYAVLVGPHNTTGDSQNPSNGSTSSSSRARVLAM